jgi:hypothetical protein
VRAERANDRYFLAFIELGEQSPSSVKGRLRGAPEEMVETDVPSGSPEEESIARHGHFGKSSKAEAVM